MISYNKWLHNVNTISDFITIMSILSESKVAKV